MEKVIKKFKEENPQIPEYLLEEVKENLPAKVTEKQVGEILENLKKEYENAKVSHYESIGTITAQSVGEPATQMTLDTFHFAGVESMNITMGLPRIIEILDAKKKISSPLMWVYLKDGKNFDTVKNFAFRIKETKLNDIAEKIDMDLENKVIIINLEKQSVDNLGINLDKISSSIKKFTKNDIHIEGYQMKIELGENTGFKDMVSSKKLIGEVLVGGIKGIEDVSILTRDEEYIIQTKGTALYHLSGYEEVDLNRTYSNDIFEINKMFGIEAARNVILQELKSVINNQGLSIDERHLMLLADMMTYNGEVKGITRYGIVAEKLNVLTRAAFETPDKHIARGALYGEENELTSVTENVMTNQIATVGTGIPRISVKDSDKASEKKAKKSSKSTTTKSKKTQEKAESAAE